MCDGIAAPGIPLSGGDPDDILCGIEANDVITGGAGADTITGGAGNDDIDGGAGADTIMGDAGDDVLKGGSGGDTIYGGEGNDELHGGGGSNMLDGGDGKDIAVYLDSARVNANLGTGKAIHIPAKVSFENRGGEDRLTGIEDLKGSHGADVINGDNDPNLLKGLDGVDVINGHGGDDTILPNRPAGPMGAANVSDVVDGETVNAIDGVDTVNGGADTDTISYEGEAEAVTINLGEIVEATTDTPPVAAHVAATVDGVTDMIVVDDKGTADTDDDLSTIENIVGGVNGDTLTGDARNNSLKGLAGDDDLTGGGGDDMLDGGAGNDDFDGGAGNDMIYADNTDTQADINGGNTVDDPDTAAVDESVAPSEKDTVSYAMVPDTDETTPGRQGVMASLDDMMEVENLTGSPGSDDLTGDEFDNVIMGGGGEDALTGGAGADTLNGGPGKDTVTGGEGNDAIVVFSGEGPDTITDWNVAVAATNVKGDDLHLKNFATETATVAITTATNVAVSVGDTLVLNVTAGTTADVNTPDVIKKDLEAPGKIVFVTTN
jgi:Ca2+-binding RTX toxin-like protein